VLLFRILVSEEQLIEAHEYDNSIRTPSSTLDRRGHNILSSPSVFEENVELSRLLQQQHLAGILLGRYTVSPQSSPSRNRGGSSDSAEQGSPTSSEPDTHSYLGPQPNERRVFSSGGLRQRSSSGQDNDSNGITTGRRRRNTLSERPNPSRFPDFTR
jgi:hypothetical protein